MMLLNLLLTFALARAEQPPPPAPAVKTAASAVDPGKEPDAMMLILKDEVLGADRKPSPVISDLSAFKTDAGAVTFSRADFNDFLSAERKRGLHVQVGPEK